MGVFLTDERVSRNFEMQKQKLAFLSKILIQFPHTMGIKTKDDSTTVRLRKAFTQDLTVD